jgi:hypothetical protein
MAFPWPHFFTKNSLVFVEIRFSIAENLGSGAMAKRRYLVRDSRSAGQFFSQLAEKNCKASR